MFFLPIFDVVTGLVKKKIIIHKNSHKKMSVRNVNLPVWTAHRCYAALDITDIDPHFINTGS